MLIVTGLMVHAGWIPYAPILNHAPGAAESGSWWWILVMTTLIVSVGGAVLVLVAQIVRRLREREAELLAMAATDPLTGVANRRRFMELLEREVQRAARHKTPLTCVIIDLDQFKGINDRHGHLVGDRVLAGAAQMLAKSLRVNDVLARWGGEEFVLLLPETDLAGAETVAERSRRVLETTPIDVGGGVMVCVTASMGIAQLSGTTGELLKRADDALYRAKAAGRNRVVAA
jgi:diguanylate cyclase (GGDEF)-like protein